MFCSLTGVFWTVLRYSRTFSNNYDTHINISETNYLIIFVLSTLSLKIQHVISVHQRSDVLMILDILT